MSQIELARPVQAAAAAVCSLHAVIRCWN